MMAVEDVNKMKGKNSVRFIHCLLFLRNEFTNTVAKILTSLFFPPQFQHFIKVADLKKINVTSSINKCRVVWLSHHSLAQNNYDLQNIIVECGLALSLRRTHKIITTSKK